VRSRGDRSSSFSLRRRSTKIVPCRVRVATPPPVPSSGFLPLSTVLAALAARTNPLRSPPFAVTPRRFAALFHAARAHWSRPSELSLPEEPCPISRAFASLRVRVRPPNGAARARRSRAVSPSCPPLAVAHPKVRRTPGQRRWFPVIARRARFAPGGASTAPSFSYAPGSPDGGRHARFEALLSSRVRSRSTSPWPGWLIARSVLSWAFGPSRVCSSRPWVRCRVSARGTERARAPTEIHVRSRELMPWLRVLARNEPRRLRSRTQDPSARAVDQTTHATVEQRPCL